MTIARAIVFPLILILRDNLSRATTVLAVGAVPLLQAPDRRDPLDPRTPGPFGVQLVLRVLFLSRPQGR